MSITYAVPPSQLHEVFTADDLRRLASHYGSDPWDSRRADLRVGIQTALIAQALCSRKGGRPFTAQDFMPFEPKPEVDEGRVARKLALYGGYLRALGKGRVDG